MGKVILVPPPVRLNLPKPSNGGSVWSGQERIVPVQFNSYGSGRQLPNGQYVTDAFSGIVAIPDPHNEYVSIDPMLSYGAYYDFSGTNVGSSVSNRANHASPLIHRLPLTRVVRLFWDRFEVEKAVEQFAGDVLLQIDNQSEAWENSWNFLITNFEDRDLLKALMEGEKSHKFEIHKAFRQECATWLRSLASDYDFFEGSSTRDHDTYYIRDDAQAIHFKMEWYAREPEEEEEEILF